MIVGFTGTQTGLTRAQLASLDGVVSALWMIDPGLVAHHGDCIEADASFHTICESHQIKLIGHPPDTDGKRAHCRFDEERPPLPYLIRNRNIVDTSNIMIACPKEDRMQIRSGTWATVRYATQIGRPIAFVFPLGYVVLPDGWPTEGDEPSTR